MRPEAAIRCSSEKREGIDGSPDERLVFLTLESKGVLNHQGCATEAAAPGRDNKAAAVVKRLEESRLRCHVGTV